MKKPLHGSKFKEFRQQIVNLSTSTTEHIVVGIQLVGLLWVMIYI